jgi:hypothetical protein
MACIGPAPATLLCRRWLVLVFRASMQVKGLAGVRVSGEHLHQQEQVSRCSGRAARTVTPSGEGVEQATTDAAAAVGGRHERPRRTSATPKRSHRRIGDRGGSGRLVLEQQESGRRHVVMPEWKADAVARLVEEPVPRADDRRCDNEPERVDPTDWTGSPRSTVGSEFIRPVNGSSGVGDLRPGSRRRA